MYFRKNVAGMKNCIDTVGGARYCNDVFSATLQYYCDKTLDLDIRRGHELIYRGNHETRPAAYAAMQSTIELYKAGAAMLRSVTRCYGTIEKNKAAGRDITADAVKLRAMLQAIKAGNPAAYYKLTDTMYTSILYMVHSAAGAL